MASTPFTKGKKSERGGATSSGTFRKGTGGFTATGTTKGAMVTGKKKAPKGAMKMSRGK